jgi:hypothetical protein
MPRHSASLLLLLLALNGVGQSPVTAPIADSLKKDAALVVRSNEMEIEIISPRKAKIHHRYVYTILNSLGDLYAHVHTFYDPFHDLVSATGILYDADGKMLKKIKKGDMQDWNTDGGGILMSDTRIKYYPFVSRTYPYTVSYEEEVEMNGLFMLPEWLPQPARNVAVENCRLVITAPAGYPLRYKAYAYAGEVAITENKGNKTYSWQLNNRPALPEEPYERAWYHRETRVQLVPGNFELEGYKGQLYSWTDIGKFVSTLYQGRDQLPDEARQKVHQLVDGLTDDRQKIAVLYKFLQQNTHYVGIELGIGGWQPFDASYVYNKRYGDCKALANYMVTLLKEAGIRASNVLIRAGFNAPALDTSFACAQFNHAIAVAFVDRRPGSDPKDGSPPGPDSIWLECTSAILAPGYLGTFTSDRDALLFDKDGGHIVHTPVYSVRENHFSRLVKGNISMEGNLEAHLVCDYSGMEQDALQSQLDRLSKKDQLKERQQSLGISNVTVKNLAYTSDSTAIPAIRETIDLFAEQFATVSGNRLLFYPGSFFKRMNGLKEETLSRTTGFEISFSYEETDSVVLQIPPGYQPESAPFSASYSCPCGSYRVHSTCSDGLFTLVCRFRQNKGQYDAATWSRLVHFFNLVHREGNRQLAFIKQ